MVEYARVLEQSKVRLPDLLWHIDLRASLRHMKYVSWQKGMVSSKETSSPLFSLLLKRRGYSVSPHGDENYCFANEIFLLANL